MNSTLVVNFTDVTNDRAISKCLRESDFNGLTFDKVYLTGASAPAFFAEKQVADKPADAEITYSASWILLKDSDGFSQTVTMLDAPTRVKISKADITTHEEIPGATLRVLDKDGNVVDEWVSEDTPHYMEAMLVAGETYTLEETLVPDGSGMYPPTPFSSRLRMTARFRTFSCRMTTRRCEFPRPTLPPARKSAVQS